MNSIRVILTVGLVALLSCTGCTDSSESSFGILPAPAVGAETGAETASGHAAAEKAIRAAIGEDGKSASIQPTPVGGLYEVVLGSRVVYMSGDGLYLLQGELVDLKKRISLTDMRRREVQLANRVVYKKLIDSVSEDKMIVFEPEETKYTITVFTDIECGYCRKLHKELDQYLAEGIRIRYLLYPRAGVGSRSYHTSVSVLCSEDRNTALTAAKAGKKIEMIRCDSPIGEHMELADKLDLTGTPMIVLEDGTIQPGYVPAKPLAEKLSQVSGL